MHCLLQRRGQHIKPRRGRQSEKHWHVSWTSFWMHAAQLRAWTEADTNDFQKSSRSTHPRVAEAQLHVVCIHVPGTLVRYRMCSEVPFVCSSSRRTARQSNESPMPVSFKHSPNLPRPPQGSRRALCPCCCRSHKSRYPTPAFVLGCKHPLPDTPARAPALK